MVLLNHVILPVNKALCRGSKSSNHDQLFHFACQVLLLPHTAGHVLEMIHRARLFESGLT